MRLFGKRRAPAEGGARPALSASASIGGGEWPPSYEAQVRAAYGRNPVAQRAVKLVAEAVQGAPLTGEPALVALVQARSAGQGLLEAAAAQLLLHGNAFVQVLRGPDGGAAELYALRPERVAEDQLTVSRATYLAGEAASVPLVEVREAVGE